MKPISNSTSSSKDKSNTSRPYGLEALALAALSGGLNDNNNINGGGSNGISTNNNNKNTMNSSSESISNHNDKSGSAPNESNHLSKSTPMLPSSLSTPKAAPSFLSRMTPSSVGAPSPNQPSQIPQAILQQLLQEPSILSLLSRLEQQHPNTNGSPSGLLVHNPSSSSSSLTAAAGIYTSLPNGLTQEPVTTRSGRPSRPPQTLLQTPHHLSHVDDQLAALHQAWAGLDTSFLDGIAGSLNVLNSLPSSGPTSTNLPTDPFVSSTSLLATPLHNSNVAGIATDPSASLDLDWWWPFQDEENEDEDPSYDPSTAYPDLTPPTFDPVTPGISTTGFVIRDTSQPAASASGSMERLLNNASRTSSKREGKGKAILEGFLEATIANTSLNTDATKPNDTDSAPSNSSSKDGDATNVSSIQEEQDDEEDEPSTLSIPGGRLLRKRKVKENPPPPPPKRVKLTAEESAARRKARNKELASNSRKRQRDYVVGLEARIVKLEAEVKKYKLLSQQAARNTDNKAGPGKNIYDVVSGGINNPHPFAKLPSIPASVLYKDPSSKKKSLKKKLPLEEEEEEPSLDIVWQEEEEEEEDDEWQSQEDGEKKKTNKYIEEIEERSAQASRTETGLSEEGGEEIQVEEDHHQDNGEEEAEEEEAEDEDDEDEEEEDDENDDDSESENSSMEDEDDEDLYQPIIDVPIPVELAPPPPDAQMETTLRGSPRSTGASDSIPAGDKVGNEEIMNLLKKLLAKMGGA